MASLIRGCGWIKEALYEKEQSLFGQTKYGNAVYRPGGDRHGGPVRHYFLRGVRAADLALRPGLSGHRRGDQHILGTDSVGRDLLSRLFYGGRTTIVGGLAIISLSILLGLPIGLFCGYYGGLIDSIFMRVCDILLSFPSMLLAFVLVAGFGRGSMNNAIIALGVIYVPGLARLVRSLTLVEKNKVYVEALRSMCYSNLRIMFVHIIPNCISSVIIQLTLDMGYAVLDLAGMSFLGFGVQAPTADWGNMLNEGRGYLMQKPMLAILPGLCIIALVVSLNIFSDGLYRLCAFCGRSFVLA